MLESVEITVAQTATIADLKAEIKWKSGMTCITVHRQRPRVTPKNAQTLEEMGLLLHLEVEVRKQQQVDGVVRAATRVRLGKQTAEACRKFGD